LRQRDRRSELRLYLPARGLTEPQDALAAIGGALVVIQIEERIIKLCMQYVLHGEEALSYEKLLSQEAQQSKWTLGQFLGQLRQRADIDASFDDQLREFLKMRNELAHHLLEIPGLGFSKPKELEFTIKWAHKLSGLAWHVHNVFMGLARAWQDQIGIQDDQMRVPGFAEDELVRKIDTQFKPLVDHVFTSKVVVVSAREPINPIITCFCNGPSCVNPFQAWFSKIAVLFIVFWFG
jgi:hypothetical protein